MLGQAINNAGASANTDACGNNNSFTIENENCMETRGYALSGNNGETSRFCRLNSWDFEHYFSLVPLNSSFHSLYEHHFSLGSSE